MDLLYRLVLLLMEIFDFRASQRRNSWRANNRDAIKVGFSRAWTSIRDSNTSSVITAVILFWFGSSLVSRLYLTLGLGSICMLSADSYENYSTGFNFK